MKCEICRINLQSYEWKSHFQLYETANPRSRRNFSLYFRLLMNWLNVFTTRNSRIARSKSSNFGPGMLQEIFAAIWKTMVVGKAWKLPKGFLFIRNGKVLDFESHWLLRPKTNRPPDYARFPSIPFHSWKKFLAWATPRRAMYSRLVQECFQFSELYQSAVPLTAPLHSRLINQSDSLGPDIISYRFSRLEKLEISGVNTGDLWTTEYFSDVDQSVEVPTEAHVHQILLRYTPDLKKFEEFLLHIDDLQERRNGVAILQNLLVFAWCIIYLLIEGAEVSICRSHRTGYSQFYNIAAQPLEERFLWNSSMATFELVHAVPRPTEHLEPRFDLVPPGG